MDKDILLLSQHLESLKGDILTFSKFNNIIKSKQEEFKQSLIEERKADILKAERKKELEILNLELLQLESRIKAQEESKSKINELLSLSDWLSLQFLNLIDFIERNVLLKVRLEFSKLFNQWFHMLAGESFEAQLDENFTPLIMQGEIEMDYSFLSGGERTAVALAYRLSLNQTINSIHSMIKTKDIVILDEPTEGFSQTQIEKIKDILEELSVNQLIIVSHEPQIEQFVDHVIRIKKESDVSILEPLQQ